VCGGHHDEAQEGLLVIRGSAPDGLVFELVAQARMNRTVC
jgi:hypothetical protein